MKKLALITGVYRDLYEDLQRKLGPHLDIDLSNLLESSTYEDIEDIGEAAWEEIDQKRVIKYLT